MLLPRAAAALQKSCFRSVHPHHRQYPSSNTPISNIKRLGPAGQAIQDESFLFVWQVSEAVLDEMKDLQLFVEAACYCISTFYLPRLMGHGVVV